MFHRIAVLADIHGNLPALEAVLAEVDRLGVDRLVLNRDIATACARPTTRWLPPHG